MFRQVASVSRGTELSWRSYCPPFSQKPILLNSQGQRSGCTSVCELADRMTFTPGFRANLGLFFKIDAHYLAARRFVNHRASPEIERRENRAVVTACYREKTSLRRWGKTPIFAVVCSWFFRNLTLIIMKNSMLLYWELSNKIERNCDFTTSLKTSEGCPLVMRGESSRVKVVLVLPFLRALKHKTGCWFPFWKRVGAWKVFVQV